MYSFESNQMHQEAPVPPNVQLNYECDEQVHPVGKFLHITCMDMSWQFIPHTYQQNQYQLSQ